MVDGAGESGDNASFAIKDAVEPRAPLIMAARFTPPIVKEKEKSSRLIGASKCKLYSQKIPSFLSFDHLVPPIYQWWGGFYSILL